MNEMLKKLAESGELGLGLAVGAAVTHAAHRMASKERIERDKLNFEREQSLCRQLDTKEKRIDELHNRLNSKGKRRPGK